MSETFYITTPIYYVNGMPHIGHAYTTIAADAAARWHRSCGREARLLTGTDEHGQKVLDEAVRRGLTPKEHCDDLVVRWKAIWERLGIQYDRFIRTTDADHIAAVQAVLQRLWDEGLIYKDSYTGWYSKAVERFWTEKDLIDGRCPESGQPVVKITEDNYFFRMSRYQADLVAHIEANPDYIQPRNRRNEVLGFLRRELEDLCISRPKTRMSWGIEIPFDRDYVTYVWFDALLNYTTGVGYPNTDDPLWRFWPVDYHLIGKDILTTHAVYWSTMLLALGVPLPKTFYAHGWWLSGDGAKMSKSVGNVVDVELLADAFGVDATRYFFLREIAFGADGGFTYDGFLKRYNDDLANDLGNLAHRAISMTQKWFHGQVPEWGVDQTGVDELRALAAESFKTFTAEIEALQFHKALDAAFAPVRFANKHIETRAPWELNKAGDTDALATAMRLWLEVCLFAAALLLPVMPERSVELARRLGMTKSHLEAALTALHRGFAPLQALSTGAPLDLPEPLFPRFRELPERIAALFAPQTEPEPAPEETPPVSETPPEPAKERPPLKELIEYDDFAKLDLRAATVIAAQRHPNADRLLQLTVDVGEPEPRTIVAGIASRFSPEELVGRQIVVVANLKPAKLRGVMSQGMLLAAGGPAVIDLVGVAAPPGEIVK